MGRGYRWCSGGDAAGIFVTQTQEVEGTVNSQKPQPRNCYGFTSRGTGLKLIHRGYPDQQTARGIADYHTERALQFIS